MKIDLSLVDSQEKEYLVNNNLAKTEEQFNIWFLSEVKIYEEYSVADLQIAISETEDLKFHSGLTKDFFPIKSLRVRAQKHALQNKPEVVAKRVKAEKAAKATNTKSLKTLKASLKEDSKAQVKKVKAVVKKKAPAKTKAKKSRSAKVAK